MFFTMLCCTSGSIILSLHCRLPFYYELKIAFVVWLLSPYTKGSSVLYRKFVHPTLSSKEKVKTLPVSDHLFYFHRCSSRKDFW